jgi:hypothetical protein
VVVSVCKTISVHDILRKCFAHLVFTSTFFHSLSLYLQVLDQVDKILLATKELTIETRTGEDRPHALNFVAGMFIYCCVNDIVFLGFPSLISILLLYSFFFKCLCGYFCIWQVWAKK